MTEQDDPFAPLPAMMRRRPAGRPLLGLRLLLVEDSRFAAEAVRLMCLKSGARLRRADSIATARRHLSAYAPAVVIIDLGLPDGEGEDLIAELNTIDGPGVLALSGDPAREDAARAAGAHGFLHKPLGGVAEFQMAVSTALPADLQQHGPRALTCGYVVPDLLALKDDLAHAVELLDAATDTQTRYYLAHFLRGLATSAGDKKLGQAALQLVEPDGHGVRAQLRDILTQRVRETSQIA
jgi:DNA-binding response OmpR family regulator